MDDVNTSGGEATNVSVEEMDGALCAASEAARGTIVHCAPSLAQVQTGSGCLESLGLEILKFIAKLCVSFGVCMSMHEFVHRYSAHEL